MAYTVDVQSTRRYATSMMRAVAVAANQALACEAASDGAALTVLLTDDAYLQELNRHYRGEDRPTDVLSFPAGEPMPGSENSLGYLGDIAISVSLAEKQAAAKGHAAEAELQLLTIHGVLHLLGYDHLEPDEKTVMWQAQANVLRNLDLENIQPSEDEHDD